MVHACAIPAEGGPGRYILGCIGQRPREGTEAGGLERHGSWVYRSAESHASRHLSTRYVLSMLRRLCSDRILPESVHHILPLLPETLGIVPTKLLLSVILALALLPFASAPFLSSKRVIFATWASIATYLLWLSCVSYAHATGTLQVSPGWIRMGALWQGISELFPSISILLM